MGIDRPCPADSLRSTAWIRALLHRSEDLRTGSISVEPAQRPRCSVGEDRRPWAALALGWEDHAQAGETARLFGIIFFVVLAAFVLMPWYIERRAAQGRPLTLPKAVAPVLAVLVLAASAGTVSTVIEAGHSGAKSVWCETMTPPDCED